MTEPTIADLHAARTAIVAAATLGTARRPFVPPAAPGALGAALAQLDPAAANEQTLLRAAALVLRFERAGVGAPAAPTNAALPPAPPDPQPACAPAAAEYLRTILGGTERAVLPEWLDLLAERGKRVPAHMLPELLNAGKNDASLRPLVRATIGTRGQWLAAQNPDWHYASIAAEMPNITLDAVGEAWQTGTRAARLALLEAVRPAAPDVARDLIASTWSSEKADDRAAFVETLGAGLSMADEPFLEAALDDRSSTVRKAAAELLARLPESRLVARIIERVSPLLQWAEPGTRLFGLVRGKNGSIAVELPEACDKAMTRDGLDSHTSHVANEGLRARWLINMLRAIPPSHWQAHWHATPEAIMAAAQAHPDHGSTLMHAWTDAARLHRDAAWAEALLHADPSLNTLLPVLPPERREALLLDLLKRASSGEEQAALFTLLRDTRQQWSVALSRAVLQRLVRAFKHQPSNAHYTLWQTLNEAALRMPPALLPEIAALQFGSADAQQRWRDASERMLNTIHFRRDMAQALNA